MLRIESIRSSQTWPWLGSKQSTNHCRSWWASSATNEQAGIWSHVCMSLTRNHRCRMKKHVERVPKSIKLSSFHTIQHKPFFPNNLTLQFKTPDGRSIDSILDARNNFRSESSWELGAMAWDELGNDAPGRSVWTAKGSSFVVQRLDYGQKVRGRNVMSEEWVYSLPSKIYIQAIVIIFIRLFSSPSLLSNLSQAFTKRPQQNKVPELKRELQRRQLDPVGTRKELTARLLEHDQLNLQVEKEERPTKPFWHFHVMDVLSDEVIQLSLWTFLASTKYEPRSQSICIL